MLSLLALTLFPIALCQMYGYGMGGYPYGSMMYNQLGSLYGQGMGGYGMYGQYPYSSMMQGMQGYGGMSPYGGMGMGDMSGMGAYSGYGMYGMGMMGQQPQMGLGQQMGMGQQNMGQSLINRGNSRLGHRKRIQSTSRFGSQHQGCSSGGCNSGSWLDRAKTAKKA